jgi:uncharacterized membrane protein
VIDMKLQLNEAPLDRAIRVVLGIVIGTVAVAGALATPWLYAAWVVAAILVVTGIVGFCPLYAILRVSTKPHAR